MNSVRKLLQSRLFCLSLLTPLADGGDAPHVVAVCLVPVHRFIVRSAHDFDFGGQDFLGWSYLYWQLNVREGFCIGRRENEATAYVIAYLAVPSVVSFS